MLSTARSQPNWRRLWQTNAPVAAMSILLGLLTVLPLLVLGYGVFVNTNFLGPVAKPIPFWENVIQIYAASGTRTLVTNTVVYALGALAVAMVGAVSLAWLLERTDVPFKQVIRSLNLVPVIIPGVLYGFAWIFLASPKIGLLNKLPVLWFNFQSGPFDIYSMAGMIWVEGTHLSPLAFLLFSGYFRSMDPSLEEAATMSQAGFWYNFYHVTIKLASPAVLSAAILLFIRTIESFETPAIIGMPGGIYVFTTRIFALVQGWPPRYQTAGIFGVSLVLATAVLLLWHTRITRLSERFSTVTGRGFRPRLIPLGKYRYLCGCLVLLYFVIVVGLPAGVLIWASLLPFYDVPSWAALAKVSLANYAEVLKYPNVTRSVLNSGFLAITSATATMLLTLLIASMVLKRKGFSRTLLETLAAIPLGLPGIVLALALFWTYLIIPLPIYGTIWVLFIAYVTKYLPFGMRFSVNAVIQVHPELREAAEMSGATPFYMFRKIMFPLVRPAFFAGWVFIMIMAIRELTVSILLYSRGSEVISVLIYDLWTGGYFTKVAAAAVLMMGLLVLLSLISSRLGTATHSTD